MKWLFNLYWRARGVTPYNSNSRCKRCGHKGWSHVNLLICRRFQP